MFVCPIIGLIGLILRGKGKGQIIYSIEYYVNLITAYNNVCRSSSVNNVIRKK